MTSPIRTLPQREPTTTPEPEPELRSFLLVLRRALLLIVGYIETTCQIESGKRR